MLTMAQGTKSSADHPVAVRAVDARQAPSQVMLYSRSGSSVPSDRLPPRATWNQKP